MTDTIRFHVMKVKIYYFKFLTNKKLVGYESIYEGNIDDKADF